MTGSVASIGCPVKSVTAVQACACKWATGLTQVHCVAPERLGLLFLIRIQCLIDTLCLPVVSIIDGSQDHHRPAVTVSGASGVIFPWRVSGLVISIAAGRVV